MDGNTVRALKEGIGFGLIAGVVYAIALMIAAAFVEMPAVVPIRLWASVVDGVDALSATSGAVLVTGVIVHLVLAAIFGGVYGLFDGALSADLRASYLWQAGLGLLFGVALWLVDYQIIARVVYPWFLEQNQLFHCAMHAIFFGLPLGLMIAASERMVFAAPKRTSFARH